MIDSASLGPVGPDAGLVRNPLIVALDVDSREACLRLARALASRAGAFKLGPRLLVREGQAIVREISAFAPVFVDNKYLDIPNTMESAIRATFDAGATLATVHAWAGREALTRLAGVEAELSSRRPFRILAVTILTSFDQLGLPPPLQNYPIDGQVIGLADLAVESGLSGIVCSPLEAANLRARHPRAFLVTPGVRAESLALAENDDQKRAMGPRQALQAGASALVVGRPIVEAHDPVAVAESFLRAIEGETA